MSASRQTASNTSPIVLITGADRPKGIGYAVTAQLGRQGMKIILTARNGDEAQDRAEELVAQGLDVIARPLDVTDEKAVRSLASEIEQQFGRLDVLINNAAGLSPFGEQAATADLGNAHQVMETTLFGAWRLTQMLLPLLRKSRHPRIVNVSSGAGSHGDTAFGLTTDNAMGIGYFVSSPEPKTVARMACHSL